MAIQNNFPALKPTLLLDFANVERLDPRVSFARASAATYYGTQTAKAEENLFLRSQELDAAAWTVTRASITANATTAPDGTTTAEKLVEDSTAANTHSVQQAVTLTANTHAVSVFAKKSEKNFLSISTFLSTAARTFFNLDAGTVGTTAAGHTASMVDVGNGWYRCIVVFTATAASWSMRFEIAEADNDVTIDGNGTDGIFLWGAQLEQRSAVTAYTPTTTQPITNYIPVLESAASGVARFDHNPNTFESLGLLIEESRTNLLERSEEFDNAYWTKARSSIVANTVIAPDGTLTGDKLVENTDLNTHLVSRSFTPTGNTTYTFSVYLKKAERDFAIVFIGNFSNQVASNSVRINLITGEFTATDTARTTITSVGNGWYRLTTTATTIASPSGVISPQVQTSVDGITGTYTGDGFSGIFIWGAQLEVGAFATSYIPTVASQVTRSADVAFISADAFAPLYNSAESTMYSEASSLGGSGSDTTVGGSLFGDGNNRIRFGLTTSTGNFTLSGRLSGDTVTRASTQISAVGQIPMTKFAFAISQNAYPTRAANGVASDAWTTGNAGTLLAAPELRIGNFSAALTQAQNGTIKKIAYYPKRLTNAEIVSLTS